MKHTKKTLENIDKLNERILSVIDDFKDKVPIYEIIFALIKTGAEISYLNAPNEKLATNTIDASIQVGKRQANDYKQEQAENQK